MDVESLLLETVTEIRRRAGMDGQARSEYDLVQLSGLLRKVLLDGSKSLIHQANRAHGLKLKFVVNVASSLSNDPEPVLWAQGDTLDPEASIGLRVDAQELSLDKFIAHNVLYCQGTWVSVGEVIRYGAHILGGVHKGAPSSRADRLLAGLPSEVLILGAPLVASTLPAIARVTVAGVEPLRGKIVDRTGTSGSPG